MRYEIGQKVLVCRVDFFNEENPFRRVYCPWLKDVLRGIEIEELEVMEHHKVAYSQDPKQELKYDGFVLVDKKGGKWFNQYPSASYSQTSTDRDYCFTTGQQLSYFTDVTVRLASIAQGIRYFADDIPIASDSLKKHLEDIVTLVEEKSTFRVRVKADQLLEENEEIKKKFYLIDPDFKKQQVEFFLEQKQHGQFTCPNCGSHYFGTKQQPEKQDIGYCKGEKAENGCEFTWLRSDLELYKKMFSFLSQEKHMATTKKSAAKAPAKAPATPVKKKK